MGGVIGGLLGLGYRRLTAAGMDDLPPLPEPFDPPDVDDLAGTPDDFSDVPGVPSLSELLSPSGLAPPSLGALVGTEPAAPPTSYAATIDTGIACLPCFRRHVSTATTAAEHAAAAMATGNVQMAKEEAVRAAGEVLLFHLYDLTPEKIAATDQETMAVINAARPTLIQAAETLPKPPLPALAAWSSVNEAVRFARSEEPDAGDRDQIAIRLRPALHWLDETESILLAPERTANLPPAQRQAARVAADELRQARHYLSPEGRPGGADGMEQGAAHLFAAAVALTPDPDPAAIQRARALAAEARDLLDDHLMAKMRGGRA